MRRFLVVLLLCATATAWYGVASRSSALVVNGTSVSGSELATELRAVTTTPAIQCYLSELYQNAFATGAARDAVTESAVASWTGGRVEGLAIRAYVQQHYHHTPTAAEIATATSAFEGELTSLAAQHSLTCPGTAAAAVAAMPTTMRSTLIASQADSLYLIAHLKGTIPLTVPALEAYYNQHRSSFRQTCISVALVPQARVAAFEKAVRRGLSVADSAKAYSVDPSAKRGGVYGCVTPSSTAYTAIQADVAGLPLRTWSKPFSYQNGAYGLFVAVRSVGIQSFATAASTVLTDVRNANAATASKLTSTLLYYAVVRIDPSLGVWELTSNGPGIGAPTLPATFDVSAPTLFTAITPPSYR